MTVTDITCPDFIVSDTHFGHHSILDLGNRREWMRTDALAAMHDLMFSHWRAVVAPGDTVLHLGDHITSMPHRQGEIAAQLTGRIVLVTGNHDRQPPPGIVACHQAVRFRLPDGRQVLGIHDPEHAEQVIHEDDALVLHGHLHGSPPQRALAPHVEHRRFDCSMDRLLRPNPVSLTDLIGLIRVARPER